MLNWKTAEEDTRFDSGWANRVGLQPMAAAPKNPQGGGLCGIDQCCHMGTWTAGQPPALGGRLAEPWGKDRMRTPSGEDGDHQGRGQPSRTRIGSLTPRLTLKGWATAEGWASGTDTVRPPEAPPPWCSV